ncbi:MAG: DedA family protein [Proteobacteria bacterium]|nr:DedA family protein [Cystobacterineae bacterium]MCL2259518.1 DedA family protein [Cystobacterineae bacterium]MCL2314021.1 DedA family protein [Pseudomonadota bacterium]
MGQKFLEWADSWIQGLGPWGYGVLALAALLEYLFPPFPGDSVVVLGGIWAWRTSQSWLGVWAVVALGNILGIGIQHRIGHILVQRVQGREAGRVVKRLKAWGLTEERLAGMQERICRHSVALLLANRFLPSLRALVFLAAGASGLSLKKTLGWGVLGSLVWSAFILGIGAWVGGNVERVLGLLEGYQTVAAWVLGAAVVFWVCYKLWKRRR